MPEYLFSEEILPVVQTEILLVQLESMSSCPDTGCLEKEADLYLQTPSFQAAIGSGRVSSEPPPGLRNPAPSATSYMTYSCLYHPESN